MVHNEEQKVPFNKARSLKVIGAALITLFAIVAIIEFRALKHDNGVFCYPLDDAFIHLALAKNVAHYGNWGATRFRFESASSSLLWTVILSACTLAVSNTVLVPFVVNVIAAIILIIVIQRWLEKQNIGTSAQILILICVIYFTPLPLLIVSGMEHTIQCLVSFLFIYTFATWIGKVSQQQEGKWVLPWQLYIYGFLATAVRYEGMFIIAIAGLILLYYRRIFTAISLGIISLLPILIYGIYSLSKGSYFFPNSVLLKSNSETKGILSQISRIFGERLSTGTIEAAATQRLLLILPIAYLIFKSNIIGRPAYKFIMLIVSACAFLQLGFASTGWYDRYEAYLILCSVPLLGVLICKYGKSILYKTDKKYYLIYTLIAFLLISPLVFRSAHGLKISSNAIENIYDQQYQMGQFMKKYYNNDKIAANDIGCVFYFTQGDNLDLWGLSELEIAKSKRNHTCTPDFLYNITKKKDIKVAVIYDSWFDKEMYGRWTKVATWTIPHNVIDGDDNVSFYAIDKNYQPGLKANLQQFQNSLPKGVTVEYY